MIDLVCLSIAVGLVVSLLFSETLGKAAGGLVVPGYLALHLTRPLDILFTVITAAATYAIVYWASSVLVIYGKRRTAAMILVGFLLGAAVRMALLRAAPGIADPQYAGIAVIGFIIPGLIAIWFDRQGLLDTCSTMLTASVAVRLVLVLFATTQLQMFELQHTPPQPTMAEPSPPTLAVEASTIPQLPGLEQ